VLVVRDGRPLHQRAAERATGGWTVTGPNWLVIVQDSGWATPIGALLSSIDSGSTETPSVTAFSVNGLLRTRRSTNDQRAAGDGSGI
jgi:hypothetical protein